MADDSDMEIDPAIAEAMGFSGFGMQAGKKRKYDTNDSFVDPEINTATAPSKGKGANDTTLGSRSTGTLSDSNGHVDVGTLPAAASSKTTADRQPDAKHIAIQDASAPRPDGGWDLNALRRGVRNENGDTVYFLPSFIEDPWKHLEKR